MARELIRQPDAGLELAGEILVKGTSGSGDSGGSTIIPMSAQDNIDALSIGGGGAGGATTTPSTLELLQTGPVNITDRYASQVQKYENLKTDYLQKVEEFGENSPEAILAKMDMGDQEKIVVQIAQDNGFVGYPDGIVTAEAQIEAAENQTIVGTLANSLYNAATSVPVVGGFLGDVVSEVGDFLDDSDIKIVLTPTGVTATATTRGSSGSGITSGMSQVPYIPVFTTTAGPGATITGGISSGNKIFDRVVQILRGQGVTEEAIRSATGAILGDILKGTPEGQIAATVYDLVKDVLKNKKDSETTTTTTTTTTTQSETEGATEGAGAVSEEKQAAMDAAQQAVSTGDLDGARKILVTAGISLKDIEEFLKGDSDDTTTTTTKTCWDGTVIAADADCPPSKICPENTEKGGQEIGVNDSCGKVTQTTKTCWDGSEIPIGDDCPPSKICWDGSEIAVNADCPPSKICWDGSEIAVNADCPPSKTCWDGSEIAADADCPPSKTCWDGSEIAADADCPPSKTCWDGSEIAADADCPPSKTCWDGSEIAVDADCPPSKICPDGTDRAKEEVGIDEDCNNIIICPPGTDLADKPAPDGDLTKCNTEVPICPPGTDLADKPA
jgi:hypothetical protein